MPGSIVISVYFVFLRQYPQMVPLDGTILVPSSCSPRKVAKGPELIYAPSSIEVLHDEGTNWLHVSYGKSSTSTLFVSVSNSPYSFRESPPRSTRPTLVGARTVSGRFRRLPEDFSFSMTLKDYGNKTEHQDYSRQSRNNESQACGVPIHQLRHS